MNQPLEICKRAKIFICEFSQEIRKNITEPRYFTESWIYSSLTQLMVHIDELVAVSKSDQTRGYEEVKAELLFIARKQLDIIGHAFGVLNMTDAHDIGFNIEISKLDIDDDAEVYYDVTSSQPTRSALIDLYTNRELKEALANEDPFDLLYTV